MYEVVIDTSVLIAALRSKRGASFCLLSRLASDDRVRWNLSAALVLEYESVAKREAPKLGIPLAAIDDIIDMICQAGHHHSIWFRVRPTLPDPNDEFLLELACACNCDFLITHNVRDLAASIEFGIRVVTPGEFLRILGVAESQ